MKDDYATIVLTKEQAQLVEKMCDNELHYKIHESGCCNEYKNEIRALLAILRPLNRRLYNEYKADFIKVKQEDRGY